MFSAKKHSFLRNDKDVAAGLVENSNVIAFVAIKSAAGTIYCKLWSHSFYTIPELSVPTIFDNIEWTEEGLGSMETFFTKIKRILSLKSAIGTYVVQEHLSMPKTTFKLEICFLNSIRVTQKVCLVLGLFC